MEIWKKGYLDYMLLTWRQRRRRPCGAGKGRSFLHHENEPRHSTRTQVALRISAFFTNEGGDDMICRPRGAGGKKIRVGEAGQQQSSNKRKEGLREATTED
jgi:hypothetical protein